MTADEERRIQELTSLIENEKDPDVVERLAAEPFRVLTKKLEDMERSEDR